MTTFSYRALARGGVLEAGRLDAPTPSAARHALSSRGLVPVSLSAERDIRHRFGRRRGRVRTRDLAAGLQGLATLLEAGLPLDQALGALDTLAPPAWHGPIPGMRSSVREGGSLSSALETRALGLPASALGIVRAAEAGGGLAAGVRRAADLLEADAEFRTAVRSALAYPLLLAVAAIGSLTLLVGVVLPRFALILEDLGQTLPATTRWVLGGAQVARAAGMPAALVLAASVVGWRIWISTPRGRRGWHSFLLSLPAVGALRLSGISGRVCEALSALLASGATLPRALRHAADSGGDAAIAERFESVRQSVVRGERLAPSLESAGALTPTAIRLVAAGEHSGRLAEMVRRAGAVETRRAREGVQRAVRLIEPVMILCFGVAVAFVAAALLQAVYAVRPGP